MRKEMAAGAVVRHGVSISLACRTFSISETCYRYRRQLSDENAVIADWLVKLTWNRPVGGFGWNHKRVYRTYFEQELNLRIKPRKRLK